MTSGPDFKTSGNDVLLHITTAAQWAEALVNGAYAADSLATEGFIHCSRPRQVTWVANQRFVGRRDLVVLHVDSAKLQSEVRYENLEGGVELFPHVYGPIPAAAIVRVTAMVPGDDGRFREAP